MKKLLLVLIAVAGFATVGCKKKQVGVCYCSYLSGDKKEYNLTNYTRNQEEDSCNVLNHYASAFAGSCKLK